MHNEIDHILICFDFVGKPEGKRPLGGSRCRPVNNIKIDLREIEWNGTRRLSEVHLYWFRKKS
jgi:hypothetical protein